MAKKMEMSLSDIQAILLNGESRWLEIKSLEEGYFRIGYSDGEQSHGGPGRRGLIATTWDGEQVFFTQGQIVGAR